MESSDLIAVEAFCAHWEIDPSFIESLHEYGLIEVIGLEDNRYLAMENLKDVEKMIRFHYDLKINMEGIDVISNLLRQIDELQRELKTAKSKLKLYDQE